MIILNKIQSKHFGTCQQSKHAGLVKLNKQKTNEIPHQECVIETAMTPSRMVRQAPAI